MPVSMLTMQWPVTCSGMSATEFQILPSNISLLLSSWRIEPFPPDTMKPSFPRKVIGDDANKHLGWFILAIAVQLPPINSSHSLRTNKLCGELNPPQTISLFWLKRIPSAPSRPIVKFGRFWQLRLELIFTISTVFKLLYPVAAIIVAISKKNTIKKYALTFKMDIII